MPCPARAYARTEVVDYKSGIASPSPPFPAPSCALSTAYVPRRAFDLIFGVLMTIAAVFLWLSAKEEHAISPTPKIAPVSEKAGTRLTERDLVDAEGVHYRYAFDLRIGVVLHLCRIFSSLPGVGGGFIHVPALSCLLNFPVHIATATSHFVLAIMALTGTWFMLCRVPLFTARGAQPCWPLVS